MKCPKCKNDIITEPIANATSTDAKVWYRCFKCGFEWRC